MKKINTNNANSEIKFMKKFIIEDQTLFFIHDYYMDFKDTFGLDESDSDTLTDKSVIEEEINIKKINDNNNPRRFNYIKDINFSFSKISFNCSEISAKESKEITEYKISKSKVDNCIGPNYDNNSELNAYNYNNDIPVIKNPKKI